MGLGHRRHPPALPAQRTGDRGTREARTGASYYAIDTERPINPYLTTSAHHDYSKIFQRCELRSLVGTNTSSQ